MNQGIEPLEISLDLGSGSAKFIFSGLPPVQVFSSSDFAGIVQGKIKNT